MSNYMYGVSQKKSPQHNQLLIIPPNQLFGENVRKCQRAFRPMVDILNIWCELGGHA